MEEILAGGVANAGAVVRVGDRVLRPARAHTPSVHRFLAALRAAGFTQVPEPLGVGADGREVLGFIEGEVGVPPYPEWVQADEALASLTALVRRFHQASAHVGLADLQWSDEMADPAGGNCEGGAAFPALEGLHRKRVPSQFASGTVVCHNDICLENVVFQDRQAVGLLDFDFAAPGDPVRDLAAMARMCVPVDDPTSAARLGWQSVDRVARTCLIAYTYGLSRSQRQQFLGCLDQSIAEGGQWVLRQVQRGDPNFIKMWNDIGGMQRFDRRRGWWRDNRAAFERALR